MLRVACFQVLITEQEIQTIPEKHFWEILQTEIDQAGMSDLDQEILGAGFSDILPVWQ